MILSRRRNARGALSLEMFLVASAIIVAVVAAVATIISPAVTNMMSGSATAMNTAAGQFANKLR